ncbi:MAG: ZIP family metal transporter [Candidatus Taylorbacteria bacterium]
MNSTIILISIATFFATLLGGLFALKLKDKLHLILGFSAGAVIAVAFFDLIPESLDLGSKYFSNNTILEITALGFIIYLLLDRLIFLHFHDHSSEHDSGHVEINHVENKHSRGILGAGSLCLHSFLDGVAIGLAFQVSTAIGSIVAVAVLVHDFSDGINTVNMILRNGSKHAFRWLIADAIAPVLGVVATLFFRVPEQGLSIILALFAGFFLYIGASDLIPESQHAHPKFLTTLMTLVGVAVLFGAIRLAGL